MRSFILASLAAVALAQSSTSVSSVDATRPATDVGTPATDVGTAATDVGTAATDVGTAATSIAALPSGHTVVNSVPAGLPTGIHTITIGNGTVTASINNSTTVILTRASTKASTRASGVAGQTGSGSGSGSNGDSGSSSSPTPTSTNAAGHIKVAGGALAGAAGFMAAFL